MEFASIPTPICYVCNDLNMVTSTSHDSIEPGGVHCAVDPDVAGRGNGEDKQEEDEEEGFQVVGRHAFHAEQNCAQQFALQLWMDLVRGFLNIRLPDIRARRIFWPDILTV